MITGTKAIKLLKNQLTNCLQFIVTHSTPHDLSLKNKIIKLKISTTMTNYVRNACKSHLKNLKKILSFLRLSKSFKNDDLHEKTIYHFPVCLLY